MIGATKQIAIGNRILRALPHETLARLEPNFTDVTLARGDVVYIANDRIRHVYFPKNGLLSLRSSTAGGSTIEVAMVGNEGLVGLPVILKQDLISHEVICQIETNARKIKAEDLQEEFDRGGALQELMLRYLNVLISEISQSSLCHRFHTLEKAFSRWLLLVQDRLNTDHLNLTQEAIAHALGVPRTEITKAAGSLQSAGLISYSRGKIAILNRQGLEDNSCECFRPMHDDLDGFLRE